MRTKSLLLLLVALGCGVVASVAVSQAVLDQGGREAVKTVDILIVVKDVSASSKISTDSVRVEQWPAERVPLGALNDIKQIDGKFTKQRLYSGEPILEAKLSSKGKEVIVPDGFRVFDIEVKSGTGADGYIGPGDRVDVIGFFKKENRTGGSKTVTVLENVEVFLVDGVAHRDPEATTQKRASTIQLLVKLSQLEVLNTATNVCQQLRLVLRPPVSEADKEAPPATDNGEKFLAWMKENEAMEKPKIESTPIATSSNSTTPSRAPQHEVLVISPTKSTVYRWSEGALAPVKVDMEAEAQAAIANNPYANAPQPYPPSYKQPMPRTNTSASTNSTSANKRTSSRSSSKDSNKEGDSKPAKSGEDSAGTPPSEPAGAGAQPNLTWDPNSGTWQSGGFNPTYP